MKKMSDKELKGKDGGLYVLNTTGNAYHPLTVAARNKTTGERVLHARGGKGATKKTYPTSQQIKSSKKK